MKTNRGLKAPAPNVRRARAVSGRDRCAGCIPVYQILGDENLLPPGQLFSHTPFAALGPWEPWGLRACFTRRAPADHDWGIWPSCSTQGRSAVTPALGAGDRARVSDRGLAFARPSKIFQFHKRFRKPSAAVSYGQKSNVWWKLGATSFRPEGSCSSKMWRRTGRVVVERPPFCAFDENPRMGPSHLQLHVGSSLPPPGDTRNAPH